MLPLATLDCGTQDWSRSATDILEEVNIQTDSDEEDSEQKNTMHTYRPVCTLNEAEEYINKLNEFALCDILDCVMTIEDLTTKETHIGEFFKI